MQLMGESSIAAALCHGHTHPSITNRTPVQLDCDCKLPVVAGAWSAQGRQQLEQLPKGSLPSCMGMVNGHQTLVMHDTGCSTVVVKSSLVDPEQLTGNTELCVFIDGVAKSFPTAVVYLDTPYYTGSAKVLRMENLIHNVIIIIIIIII